MLKEKLEKGTPGFEPGTSRSAVECSTTELYPPHAIPQFDLVLINFLTSHANFLIVTLKFRELRIGSNVNVEDS